MWKIVVPAEVLVIYIYIYIQMSEGLIKIKVKKKKIAFGKLDELLFPLKKRKKK